MNTTTSVGAALAEALEPRNLFASVLAADGDLDPSFGIGGQQVINVALQSDAATDLGSLDGGASLVLGQHFPSIGGQTFSSVIKLTPGGAPDVNFGVNGVGEFARPGAASMLVTPDGKIVVAGATIGVGTPSADGVEDLLLQRLNDDGSVDHTFGVSGGVTTTDSANRQDVAVKLLRQADGKLLVAGYEQKAFLSRVQQTPHIVLARYSADGQPDADFGVNGVIVTDIPAIGAERAASAALQADGKIVVVGSAVESEESFGNEATPAHILVMRYNADGTLDSTFSKDGIVISRKEGVATDVKVTDKRILVSATRTVKGGRAASVLAFKLNGATAASFGNAGVATADFRRLLDTTTRNDASDRLEVVAGGKIVLSCAAGGQAIGLARFTKNGRPDRSFGTAGKSVTPATAAQRVVMAVQVDGKILTATSGTDITISRHLA